MMIGTEISATMRSKATLVRATWSGMRRGELPDPRGIAADGGRKHLVEELSDIDVRRRRGEGQPAPERRGDQPPARGLHERKQGLQQPDRDERPPVAFAERQRLLRQAHLLDQPEEQAGRDEDFRRREERGRAEQPGDPPGLRCGTVLARNSTQAHFRARISDSASALRSK